MGWKRQRRMHFQAMSVNNKNSIVSSISFKIKRKIDKGMQLSSDKKRVYSRNFKIKRKLTRECRFLHTKKMGDTITKIL